MIPEQHKKKAAWVAIATSALVGFEGLRTIAYLDPVKIPTNCVGETLGVRMGDVSTVQECMDKLDNRLVTVFGPAVDKCVTHPLPDNRKVAYVSITYNIGVTNFCNSTMAKKENAGDYIGACNEFPKWKYAHGIPLPGLATRRQEEMKICMKGLQ